jgi:Fuc2NAc and GlcNAc transferase
MKVLYSLIIVIFLSFFLTGLVRYLALSWNFLDRPNHRSSHFVPTPRGGGIAIVISFYAGLVLIGDGISLSLLIALLGSGLVVALVGLLDDYSHIGVRWRLLAHFFC